MKSSRFSLVVLLTFAAFAADIQLSWTQGLAASESKGKAQIMEAYGKLPLSFIENRGQIDERVKFYEKGYGHETFFTQDGIYFTFYRQTGDPSDRLEPKAMTDDFPSAKSVESSVVRLTPVGLRKDAEIKAEERLEAKVHYFVGDDKNKWKTNVPTYRAVVYREAFSGIDLRFYGTDRNLEYDIVVKPGADPAQVNFQYTGIQDLTVTDKGDLSVKVGEGLAFIQKKPVIYQIVGGKRVEYQGAFKIRRGSSSDSCYPEKQSRDAAPHSGPSQEQSYIYGFESAPYDTRYPLIIDPQVTYANYLNFGGAGEDYALGISSDSSGNAYVTGYTWSTTLSFLSYDILQSGATSGSYVGFVRKINSQGGDLYTTYLGGNDDTYSLGIAVDSTRSVYITGYTLATNFPTVDPLPPNDRSYNDAFVTKLDSAGAIDYSTYLGGNGRDFGCGVAVSSSGNAYVTGRTTSTNFPLRNSYLARHAGGAYDAFVTKLNTSGNQLAYSTYLGGSGDDSGEDVAIDASGSAYVAGWTWSTNFPIAGNPAQNAPGGLMDAFVTKLDPTGESLAYSTYLGGSGSDAAHGIAVDSHGNAYVVGGADSIDFPTSNPIQEYRKGKSDAFVARLDDWGSTLVYSTYLGGSDNDFGYSIALDSAGNAYVTGSTKSSDFPMSNFPSDSTSKNFKNTKDSYGAAFLTKLNNAGDALAYSSYYIGQAGDDAGKGITVDSAGNVYMTGYTNNSGMTKVFAAKIGESSLPSITVLTPNGGESWQAGDSRTIAWSYTGDPGSDVKIELYKGSVQADTVIAATAIGSSGNGSYTWTIPASEPPASSYRIKITSTTNSSYTDSSYGYFTINAPSSPVADFTANPTSGDPPLTVNFSDASTGLVTEWAWSFGDSTTSTDRNPSHIYNSAGNYTVTLLAKNPGGSDSKTQQSFITVSAQSPLADFTATYTDGSAPFRVSFTDRSTSNNTINSWLWNFGDPSSPYNTSPSQSPIHTYQSSGTYTVTLTVTDSKPGTNTKTRSAYITVASPSFMVTTPTFGANWPQGSSQQITWTSYNTNAGDTLAVDLYRNDSKVLTIAPSIALANGSLEWDIPVNQTAQIGYRVCISSTDQPSYRHCSGAFNITANTYNANFTATTPTTGMSPFTVSFRDQSTGSITGWSWDFGDGSGTIPLQNPSHEYTKSGKYSVTLTVTGANGQDSITRTNYIVVQGITVTSPANEEKWAAGSTNTIRWTYAGSPGSFVKIDLYKGSSPVSTVAKSASAGSSGSGSFRCTIPPSRTPAANYRFKVTSTSNAAYTDMSDNFTITVPAPVANFTASPTTVEVGSTVAFTNTTTGSVTEWKWNFGDGQTSNEQSPEPHAYTTAGTYTVSLTAKGPGGSNTKTRTAYITVVHSSITITNPPHGVTPPTSWEVGSTHAILWTYEGNPGSFVQIDLLENGSAVSTIVSSTSMGAKGSGLYSWIIPSTLTPHDDYQIKVTSKSDNAWTDTSDNFKITPPAPVPAFSGSPRSGPASLTVKFLDASTGEITGRLWDFGDGVTSTQQNPTHTYLNPRTAPYTVSLIVTGPGGSKINTKANYITVHDYAPTANFSALPTSGTAPLTVAFNDGSTGTVTGWLWNFGDGGPTSTERNPSHVYSTPGAYTVSLTITGGGTSDIKTIANYITVSYPAPVANFTANRTSGVAPLSVSFTDSSTFLSGDHLTWSWSFGDGEASTQQNPTHLYTTPGTYTVTLSVTGSGGYDTKTRTDYITVYIPPMADFTATPRVGTPPLAVQFTDNSTGSIGAWSWTFGDGQVSTQQSPLHSYAVAGIYEVSLTATGPGGASKFTKTGYISVGAGIPTADLSGAPTSGTAPLLVSFTDSSTGTVTSRSWTFGDGGVSTQTDPSHTYNTPGTYSVSLTATGTGGYNTQTLARYITVNYAAPVAGFTGTPVSGTTPLTVSFNSTTSSGEITSWAWDFGDDSAIDTDQNPSHTYTTTGQFTVKLTVTGPGGSNSQTRSTYITVSPPPPTANFGVTPSSGAAPLSVAFNEYSSGQITSWAWDFGDGQTSSVKNPPAHLFSLTGTYPVKLTVTGPGGANTKTTNITALAPTVTVTAPNGGGAAWALGSTYNITWTYTGGPGSNVLVELVTTNNNHATTLVTTTPIGTGGSGSYSWTIPDSSSWKGTRNRIRITVSSSLGTFTDSSDADFTIN